ncbi:MAG: FecR domain-containing protein [Myxococcota bacterium]
MTKDLRALGEELAALQDEELAERDDLPQVRSRLLSPARRERRSWKWGALGFAIATAAVALLFLTREPQPLTFAHDGTDGAEGAWVTSELEMHRLDFSDGSEVELAPRSGVRVASLRAEGAQLDLQRGSMHVHVVHQSDDTHWKIQAGPFEVDVIGTAFDVAWDPGREHFALHLEEGRVRVSGPTITERIVDVGETLRVDLGERRMELVQRDPPDRDPIDELEPIDPIVDVNEDLALNEEPAEVEAPHKAPVRRRGRRLRIDWRQLADQGRHDEAIAAADWDRVLRGAPAGDVMRLANTARLAGERTRAKAAYLAVRTRFAGTTHAADAAFFLGRIEMSARRFPEAAGWFEHSIDEAPRGGYVMVARGRLMEAHRRSRDLRRARRSARSYLESYPEGPHASQARQILDEEIVANQPREAWGSVD